MQPGLERPLPERCLGSCEVVVPCKNVVGWLGNALSEVPWYFSTWVVLWYKGSVEYKGTGSIHQISCEIIAPSKNVVGWLDELVSEVL